MASGDILCSIVTRACNVSLDTPTLASLQTSAVTGSRRQRAADSPAGRFDGLRRTHPLCAVSSSSPGLRIQGPGLQNPRGHGLPCAAPGRTIGSSSGLTQSGWCSKRRSILATVPAASTPLARLAPPARCPEPARALPAIYHSSAPLLPPPSPYLCGGRARCAPAQPVRCHSQQGSPRTVRASPKFLPSTLPSSHFSLLTKTESGP